LSPLRPTIRIPKNGTVVIISEAKPLLTLLCASGMRNQGPTISIKAKARTNGQNRRAFFKSPDFRASGIKTIAPIVTLSQMMLGVEKLARANSVKKYGTPQISPASANKTNPFELTGEL
jgi:hypothetical protein